MHQIIKNDSLPGQAAPQLVDQREKPKAWTTTSPTRASPVPAAAPGASCRGDHPRAPGGRVPGCGVLHCRPPAAPRGSHSFLFHTALRAVYVLFACPASLCAVRMPCRPHAVQHRSFGTHSLPRHGIFAVDCAGRGGGAVPWGPCLGGVCAHVCVSASQVSCNGACPVCAGVTPSRQALAGGHRCSQACAFLLPCTARPLALCCQLPTLLFFNFSSGVSVTSVQDQPVTQFRPLTLLFRHSFSSPKLNSRYPPLPSQDQVPAPVAHTCNWFMAMAAPLMSLSNAFCASLPILCPPSPHHTRCYACQHLFRSKRSMARHSEQQLFAWLLFPVKFLYP